MHTARSGSVQLCPSLRRLDKSDVTGHRGTASIRDVARAARVSYQTVSRVVNDHPSVSPPTRQTVLDTIERLEYRPNRAARALAGGSVQHSHG